LLELDQLPTDLEKEDETADAPEEETGVVGSALSEVETLAGLEDGEAPGLVDGRVVGGTVDLASSGVDDVTGLVEDTGETILDSDVVSTVGDIVELGTDDGGLVGKVGDVADSAVGQVGVLEVIPNPILTVKELTKIVGVALDVPGLNEWSSDGWEFVSMDFVGETGSGGEAEWDKAIVYLHLPEGAGDPPKECSQGWSATVGIDLETEEVEDAGYPTEESHDCTSEIVLDDPDAAVRPSFVIAEADDVISNDVYGNIAYMKTPSYSDEIFDHMDRYIAHLLNQKWKTSPAHEMTQVGWLMTAVEGCTSCGDGYIPADSAVLAFTDTSVFGNLEAHKIPVDWEPDGEMLAETMCYDDENYTISVLYEGKIFNHNTKVPCENADNDSKITNSVFFENWNTVESSSWAQDITGEVEAHSAHGLMHSSREATLWTSSTNEEQSCDTSRESTTVIDGSLASGNAATWSKLDQVPSAC
ncbi:MAG: hypothetical protein ACREAW_03715, partial [Nitrososphaera sp.]